MHLLLSTIALRPYVFVFLAAFLLIAIVNYGLRTSLVFLILTYLAAFACEWSSVHNGFPFGLYHYIEAPTRDREIWIAGVPFFDSLSFTFLTFASYTLALLISAPLYRDGVDLKLLETRAIRRSPRVWFIAALFMTMVDWVADPLSVMGDRWFLGRIFWYDPPGPHFGVPISNYLGWYFLGLIGIALFQWLDARLNRGTERPYGMSPAFPSRALLGPGLYFGIVTFTITMLFHIGAAQIAWAALFIHLPFVTMVVHIVTRRESYGDAIAITAHLTDFPYDKISLPDEVMGERRIHAVRRRGSSALR